MNWSKNGDAAKAVELLAQAAQEQSKHNHDLVMALANGLIKSIESLALLHGGLIDAVPIIAKTACKPSEDSSPNSQNGTTHDAT